MYGIRFKSCCEVLFQISDAPHDLLQYLLIISIDQLQAISNIRGKCFRSVNYELYLFISKKKKENHVKIKQKKSFTILSFSNSKLNYFEAAFDLSILSTPLEVSFSNKYSLELPPNVMLSLSLNS